MRLRCSMPAPVRGVVCGHFDFPFENRIFRPAAGLFRTEQEPAVNDVLSLRGFEDGQSLRYELYMRRGERQRDMHYGDYYELASRFTMWLPAVDSGEPFIIPTNASTPVVWSGRSAILLPSVEVVHEGPEKHYLAIFEGEAVQITTILHGQLRLVVGCMASLLATFAPDPNRTR